MVWREPLQYACAVLLIVSSIALAVYQVVDIDDVANGTLMYIAQAFLLAGSVFGLDLYIKRLTQIAHEQASNDPSGNSQQ